MTEMQEAISRTMPTQHPMLISAREFAALMSVPDRPDACPAWQLFDSATMMRVARARLGR